MFSFADRVAVPSHVMVRFLDGESVFLNLDTEHYFGLDRTGTQMWRLVTSLPSIEAAYRQLLAEYDVEPALLHANLSDLLLRLSDSGLIQVVPVPSTDKAEVDDVGTPSAI